jgi:hypothetical protein
MTRGVIVHFFLLLYVVLTVAVSAAEIKDAHMTEATMGKMRVRAFRDTAVVTGSDDETSVEDGKKSVGHCVWTDVFLKRGDK